MRRFFVTTQSQAGRMLSCLTLLLMVSLSVTAHADWPRFRGPNGSGVSHDKAPLPAKFSATENLKWKVALPGPGSSSPIVVGDRIYVTCWSGYGTSRGNPGDQANLKRHLVALDRATGKRVWDKTVDPVLPEEPYRGMFAEHGYATHSPASDGERIYVFFGKTGALAFDLDGNQLWHTKIGTESDPRGWGSGSSPILYKNLVIVTATAESEALVGLDKETGKEVWRQEASGFNSTWGTPVLVEVDDKRTDLVLGVPYEIWGFNPETGKLRWYCEAMNTDSFCSSVVADKGVVYGIEGRGGGSIAVKAGGKGDVTGSHVVWSGRDSNRIATPLLYDGRLYFFSRGIANCIDASSGKRVYQGRMPGVSSGGRPGGPGSDRGARDPSQRGQGDGRQGDGRQGDGRQGDGRQGDRGGRRGGFRGGRGGGFGGDYASPIIADGKIYFVKRSGEVHVMTAGKKFESLAVNRLTSDSEDFSATPAVAGGCLFFRSSKHLYCVSQSEK